MSEGLRAALFLLTAEIAERYVGRLFIDAAAIYRYRRNDAKVESWLHHQRVPADPEIPGSSHPPRMPYGSH